VDDDIDDIPPPKRPPPQAPSSLSPSSSSSSSVSTSTTNNNNNTENTSTALVPVSGPSSVSYDKPLPVPKERKPTVVAGPEEVSVKYSVRQSVALAKIPGAVTQDLPNLEGMLEKKGDLGVIKSYKRRYFRLKADRLIYYQDQVGKDCDDPIGYIPLRSATSIEPDPRKLGAFQITTTDPPRIWYLKADSDELMNKWVNACLIHSKYNADTAAGPTLQATTPKDSKTPQDYVSLLAKKKEGFLEKLPGGVTAKMTSLTVGLQWRPRWFVLKDGILFKYNNKADSKPSKKIPLYKCRLEEYGMNGELDPSIANIQFQIITRQGTFILRVSVVFYLFISLPPSHY
jgi:hypothetical protein